MEKKPPLYPREVYSVRKYGNATVCASFAEAESNEELDRNRKGLEDAIKALFAKDNIIIGSVNFDDYPANTKRIADN